jgi:hypothetical protein
MRRAWLVVVLTVAGGLALAVGSQARLSHPALKCGPGHVRRSVRVPERKHGRLVRRHHKIVYVRVQRCVKVRKKKAPTTTPQPIPGASGNPVTTPPGTTTTTNTSTTTTTTTTPPPAPPSKPSPCSTPIPGNTLQLGQTTYTVAGEDTFTKDAPVGTFAQGSVPDASYLTPVYTGDYGMGWSAYPDGWPGSYTASTVPAYQPSTVVSVHDSVLDFYLHDDANGNPVGADLSPWPGGSEYQTYGAYSLCEKVTSPGQLADFYQATLLWPQNKSDGQCAESDFPETYSSLNGGSLDSGEIYAFAHYGAWTPQSGCPSGTWTQDGWHTPIDLSQWHVFTQEWGPGYRSYYIDGTRVYTTTHQVWSQPERWQLQMEPSPSSQVPTTKTGGTGHLYISWVWIGTPG